MSSLNNNTVLGGAAGQAGGYTIDQSLRLNRSASAYLSKTFASDGGDNYTISFWTKRCMSHSVVDFILGVPGNGGYGWEVHKFYINDDGVLTRTSTAVYRDPSAWYHVCIQNDASTGNTIYINNEVVTMSGTSNVGTVNGATTHYIGRFGSSAANFYDGYMADWVFLSDQVAAPTDFGEYNADGVWVPVDPSGLDFSGTNSHWLNFADSANLGADASGNGFDFTTTNINADDQVLDTPTANSCTMNPLDIGGPSGNVTLSDGSLVVTANSGASNQNCRGTFAMTTGKWYWEMGYTSGGSVNQRMRIGICDNTTPIASAHNTRAAYIDGYNGVANYVDASSSVVDTGTYVTFGNGDHMMFAFDADAGKLWFGKNGTWMGSPAGDPAAGTGASLESIPTGERWQPLCSPWVSNQGTFYFLEDTWTYTAPTGFNALNTANLPAQTIADGSAYFQATTYTGAGYPTEVNQSGNSTFQPDFVWIKRRSGAAARHCLFDAVRGGSSILESSDTRAENIVSGALTFDSDGFTAAVDPSFGDTGSSGNTFVGWQWLAGNGTASNTDGDITSTVSASAGFSIVSWTLGSTDNQTVGHGLSAAPEFMFLKNRDAVGGWTTYHEYNTSAPETEYLRLDSTNATVDSALPWNDTAPTSSVFTIGDVSWFGSASDEMIMYCFRSIPGFSKFGSYTGNGSTDGPFVWCGFRPAFVIVKRTDAANDWCIADSARPAYNPAYNLRANLTVAEDTTQYNTDLISNGFKIKNTTNGMNGSGASYIFIAFAEHPFGGDGVAPVPAR